MKKLLLVALAVVGLASCVQNEELVVPQNTAAISFDSFVGNATKADPSYNESTKPLEAFKVWAFMDETAGNVFTEEVVTNNGGVWSYQNLQYWYHNHDYYFAALAPVENAHWGVTVATGDAAKSGLGTVEFENINGTEDLLYAKKMVETPADAATLANNGMPAVEMDFQHLLSKVKFTFQNGFNANNTTVQVSGVTMSAPKSGTINLAQANYATEWKLGTENITLAFGNVANPLALAASAEAADERLTIPADATKEYAVSFHVAVYQGEVLAMESDINATISGIALEMGKAYNFTAVINQDVLDLKPIQFTASVDDWTPAGDFSAYIYEADGFGKDSTTGFYHIENRAGLQYFAAQVNGGRTFVGEKVVLDGDIDLSATRAASNWTPIGQVVTSTYDSKKFAGTFDGQGHSIMNMVVADQKAAAFFGSMYTGTIKNLTIENATVSSNHYAAGIVAWTERGGKALVIENCHVKNSTIVSAPELVNGAYDNGDKVGGIVGHAYGIDALKNCSVENTAITAYRDLGGIAGYATKSKITNCLVKNVTVSQDLTNGYKAEVPTTIGAVVGRYGENNVIENNTVENVDVATVVDTNAELEDALKAGGEVVLAAGTYTMPASSNFTAETVLTCEEGVVFEGKSSLNINGATVIGATFKNEGDIAVSGTIYGTLKNCTFEGEEALRWCYSEAGKPVVFENCVINNDFRGFHFDDMKGDVLFKNCHINGFNAYGGEGTATFEGCTFGTDTRSSYNGLNIYANTVLTNCTFIYKSGKTNFIDMEAVGKSLTITNCTATLDGAAANVADFVGGSKIKENTVIIDGEYAYVPGYNVKVDGYYAIGDTYTVVNGKGYKTVATTVLADGKKNVVVELAKDIDLAGIEWPAVKTAATFVLDGKGHAIKNLTTSAVEDHGFYSTAMFTTTRKAATIKNLVVENATVTGRGGDNSHGAVLVACNYASLNISGVTVKGSTISNCDRTGGLVTYLYFAAAKVENCVVEGCTINSIGTAGAILGYNNGDNFEMTNCKLVNTTISSSEGNNKAGLFIGTWAQSATLTKSGNTHTGSKAINAGVETNNEIGRLS